MGVSPSIYLPFSNWSLKPKLGESARGYFLRLVANEGHDSTTVYGNEIGINGRRLAAEEALDTMLMLPLAEEHKEALRRYSPVADGAYYDICGQRLRQRQMNVRTRRFCRACLADSPHHRVWWDIVAFGTCPEHGTPVEKTDTSGQRIGWWWADVASDMDGNPLGKWARSQPELHARTLEAFILERLDVVPSTAWPLLDRYRLYEVIEACEYLGTWLGNERTFAVPVDQLGNVALGMAALSGERADLVAAMRRWFEERVPSDIRLEGKMASMGWAWHAWPKMPGTEIGDMLNQAATEAFEPIGKMGKKRYRAEDDFYAERALSPLASELDVRMEALLPLARHLGIVPEAVEAWKLDSEQADTLRRGVAGLISSSAVTGILGLESWEWQDLVRLDRITSFGSFTLGRVFLRSEVEGLVEEVFAKASVRAAESVSLRTFARRKGLTVGAVLTEVLDGKIAAVRAGSTPDLVSIRVVAKSRRYKASRSINEAAALQVVTMAEAAAILQLNHEAISRLAGLGVLKSEGGVLVRASVIEFHHRFANAQIYRLAIGCTNIEVYDRLAAIGLSPCFGLGGLNVVVERVAARRALGLVCDPDDPRVAGNDLWEEFKSIASERCPVFTLPPTVSEVGAKLRTATRKVVVDVSVDAVAGAISLGFDIHPTLTGRRWKLFEKREVEVREALGFMKWERSQDEAGWRLTLFVENDADLRLAADALSGMHRYFK